MTDRVPKTGSEARERERLVRKLQADLRRFERIQAHRLRDECADAGEQTCRALLAELGVKA